MAYFDNKFFGIAASIVSVIAFMPYIVSILRGKTKPSGASWWTWSFLTIIIVISSWKAGASWDVLILPSWLCFSQLTVAILSVRNGDNIWDFSNLACIVGACIGIVLWLLTDEPLIALFASIVADIFATVPTFRHVWAKPEEENRIGWMLGWCSGILLIFAVNKWTLAEAGWAIYFVASMSVILIFVWRPSLGGVVRKTV